MHHLEGPEKSHQEESHSALPELIHNKYPTAKIKISAICASKVDKISMTTANLRCVGRALMNVEIRGVRHIG